jgi:hypothetical protein
MADGTEHTFGVLPDFVTEDDRPFNLKYDGWEISPWATSESMPTASIEVGHHGGYGSCSHEVELTRDDLVTLLAAVDESRARYIAWRKSEGLPDV